MATCEKVPETKKGKCYAIPEIFPKTPGYWLFSVMSGLIGGLLCAALKLRGFLR
jgi:hypothetical protein